MKAAILSAVVVLVAALIFFEIDLPLKFSLPRELEILDLDQEARFDACVAAKDRIIHQSTFRDIDNPDVQREILATKKEQAILECRQSVPEVRVTVSEPLHFNIIDLRYRY